MLTTEPAYDVALSFAGEDRAHAETLAKTLTAAGVRVFYDGYEQPKLWGKDLFQHLSAVYGEQSRYCVILISEAYLAKYWTKHELRQAQACSFEMDREYILPVRLDDAVLPGLASTISYIDLRQTTIVRVADILLQKLGKASGDVGREADRLEWDGQMVTYNGNQMASVWPKQIERAQHSRFYLTTTVLDRIVWGKEKQFRRTGDRSATCGDCGVLPGQYHVPSCDMEECPACGGQTISCGCSHQALTTDEVESWDDGEDPFEET